MRNLPPLPDEVWADPGNHDWYFREKKPDSVAKYIRADRITALEAQVAAAERVAQAYDDAGDRAIATGIRIALAAFRTGAKP